MIELFERDMKTAEYKSSKGNQLKWINGSEWYKADYTGYEGLAADNFGEIVSKCL